MAKDCHKRQVVLGESELGVIGPLPEDVQQFIGALCPAMSALFAANETIFSPPEWRAMASVMQTASVPHGRRGLDRFLYLLKEAETYDQLSQTHRVHVEEIQVKLQALEELALVGVMSTLHFALRHFPDQLDSHEWWTLAARRQPASEMLASKTAPSKQSPRRRRKVLENRPAATIDERALVTTS
jgi:hypothetical protein